MENLTRSSKSGNDWTCDDLDAYHIECRSEDPLSFFGIQALLEPQVDPELPSSFDATHVTNNSAAELLTILHLAMIPRWGESAVENLMVTLFGALGYTKRRRVALTRTRLGVLTYGEHPRQHMQADICIMNRDQNDIILVVKVEKRLEEGSGSDPEAQLIAEALAAFAMNNEQRINASVDPLDAKVCTSIRFPL
jgi:hypothetical protein